MWAFCADAHALPNWREQIRFVRRHELQSLNRKSRRARQSITRLSNLLKRRDDKIERSFLHFQDHLKFCVMPQFFSKYRRS
jgi:hypothetical protein